MNANVTILGSSNSSIEDDDCNFLSFMATKSTEEPYSMTKNARYVN